MVTFHPYSIILVFSSLRTSRVWKVPVWISCIRAFWVFQVCYTTEKYKNLIFPSKIATKRLVTFGYMEFIQYLSISSLDPKLYKAFIGWYQKFHSRENCKNVDIIKDFCKTFVVWWQKKNVLFYASLLETYFKNMYSESNLKSFINNFKNFVSAKFDSLKLQFWWILELCNLIFCHFVIFKTYKLKFWPILRVPIWRFVEK